MICGLFFIGLFSSLGVIPTIPEAVDLVALHWKWVEVKIHKIMKKLLILFHLA